MPTYYFLVFTGTYTLVQALVQFIIALVAIAQHFCVINFLRGYPLLIYIRLLYFHNPSSCGTDINIGETLENVANEAYVYISSMPVVTTRAFIFSCISFGLSVFWVAGSIVLIKGGWRKHHSNHVHWPWVAVSFFVALEDIVGVLCYINDSFHTAEVGGTGNLETSPEASSKVEEGSERSSSGPSQPGAGELPRIPRPGLSQSFRSMKDMLFGRSLSLNSLDNRNKNRVNFLPEESTLDPVHSPRSFENLIAEQQRRLRGTGVDTSGRRGSLQPARSQPHLTSNAQETARGGRSTAGQLPGQMPWAYIAGAPANRMRDQLPPDEDLPPVPLPDYTALQSGRKASVHRAASSLSSLTQKKDYKSSHPAGSSGQVDVLY
ncbi:uncharacterized protein LOC125241067 isoform X2 [Leguminivora glycinivorella]|uniref:uncharacterized protein LOC125241067 isoform X2 n=1 Tax=Leguminivora glycinivorella TaxID=1035111 RepID=UPI00200C3208|nr:uncharacterized protein LOC125241067 isoform X2 [Leguminivora glycinivorella]